MEYNKKEELLNKIRGFKKNNTDIQSDLYNKGLEDALKYTKNFFNKELVPEVPQCVIDWYEDNKDDLDDNLCNFIIGWDYHKSSNFKDWFNANNNVFQTIVNMHQFGYKVKDEKKYLVKMVGLTNRLSYLNYDYMNDNWYFKDDYNGHTVKTHHTKKQLEDAGFGWVFKCEGIEVKEVM
jgi:hypothetical protein